VQSDNGAAARRLRAAQARFRGGVAAPETILRQSRKMRAAAPHCMLKPCFKATEDK